MKELNTEQDHCDRINQKDDNKQEEKPMKSQIYRSQSFFEYPLLNQTIEADITSNRTFMYTHFKITIVLIMIVILLKLLPSPIIINIVENDPTAFTKLCDYDGCSDVEQGFEIVTIKKINPLYRQIKYFVKLNQQQMINVQALIDREEMDLLQQITWIQIYAARNNEIYGDVIYQKAGKDAYEVVVQQQPLIFIGEVHLLNEVSYIVKIYKRVWSYNTTVPLRFLQDFSQGVQNITFANQTFQMIQNNTVFQQTNTNQAQMILSGQQINVEQENNTVVEEENLQIKQNNTLSNQETNQSLSNTTSLGQGASSNLYNDSSFEELTGHIDLNNTRLQEQANNTGLEEQVNNTGLEQSNNTHLEEQSNSTNSTNSNINNNTVQNISDFEMQVNASDIQSNPEKQTPIQILTNYISVPLTVQIVRYSQFFTGAELLIRYITFLYILYVRADTTDSPNIFHFILLFTTNPLIFTEIAFPNMGSNILSTMCSSVYIFYIGIFLNYTHNQLKSKRMDLFMRIVKALGLLTLYIVNLFRQLHLIDQTYSRLTLYVLIILVLIPLLQYIWDIYFFEEKTILHRNILFIILTIYYFLLLIFNSYLVEYGWRKITFYLIILAFGVSLCYLTRPYHKLDKDKVKSYLKSLDNLRIPEASQPENHETQQNLGPELLQQQQQQLQILAKVL